MTKEFTNYGGAAKTGLTRPAATANLGRVFTRPLFLPGQHLLCVKAALAAGIIHPTKHEVLLVESRGALIPGIRKAANKLGIRYRLFHGDITRLSFNYDQAGSRLVDYAFLDFCGTCTPQVVNWLFHSKDWLAPDARLAFTFCGQTRHTEIYCRWVQKVLQLHAYQIPLAVNHNLVNSTNNWLNYIDHGRKGYELPATALVRAQFLMLAETLPYEFRLHQSFMYNDTHTPMAFYHGQLTGMTNPLFPGQTYGEACRWMKRHRQNLVMKPADLNNAQWAHHEDNPHGFKRKGSA